MLRDYMAVAVLIFAINLLPAFGPPTSAVLVAFTLNFDLAAVPLVASAAVAAASGRFVLATATRRLRPRLSGKRRDSLAAAQRHLEANRVRTTAGLGLFALSPVPSGQLFVGAGLMTVRLLPLTLSFFTGRVIAYSLYVAGAHAIKGSVGDHVLDSLTSPLGLALQALALVALVLLVRLDWVAILDHGEPKGPSEERAEPVPPGAAVDLHWIPLGAGGHSVRFNGRVFEAISAARRHTERCDLYHAALVVELDGERYTIEIAPSPNADESSRGVVGTGPVGSRHLGRLRLFRYEVRCWRGGSIPDLSHAVGGALRLTTDPGTARRILSSVRDVPRPVWGRDELGVGEMWNSNSVVAWLVASAGLPTDSLRPPPHGRAPGWSAGLEVARRSVTPPLFASALAE